LIRGIGTDIIEIPRIKKVIERDRAFVEKVFTTGEIEYCRAKFHPEIHFAARFAAKEAFFKSLGTGWRGGMRWLDISVRNDELGKPGLELSGLTLDNFNKTGSNGIHITLSHTKNYAVAFVILE